MQLILVFIGGLLGSSHCLGMCGGFALSIGSSSSGMFANLQRQLVYSLGRLATYSFAGAMMGFGGWRLAQTLPLVAVQATLAILAGSLLIVQGLYATGLVRRRRGALHKGCATSIFGSLLTGPDLKSMLLAGMLTGLLPCGLVYGFLALAGSSGSLRHGLATMVAFGLGTVPLMVLAGCGGTAINVTARRCVFRAAGWCVVATGVLSIYRGLGFLPWITGAAYAGCPYCQ